MLRAQILRRCFSSTQSVHQKTPFQVFRETFNKELKKSKELQTNIKALQDETGRLGESSAFKRAKDALDRSREARSATSKGFNKAGEALGTAASATWNSSPIKLTRTAISSAADVIDKGTEPIRETSAFKEVKNTIDDGSSLRYGGFENAEKRRKRRAAELERQRKMFGTTKHVKADENAGDSLVIHETAKPDAPESAAKSGLRNKIEGMKLAYQESDNALITAIRGVTDFIGSFFAESDRARVIRKFKEIDPHFTEEAFLREMRGYVLPEVLDAYVRGNGTVLKTWLSEAMFNIWNLTTKEYRDKGLYAAGRVLDVRHADIYDGRLLEELNGQPVYTIVCSAQETNCYKSLKTDEVVAGVPDQVLISGYVMTVTRFAEDMDNEETRGWKILQIAKGRSRDYH